MFENLKTAFDKDREVMVNELEVVEEKAQSLWARIKAYFSGIITAFRW
jgi:hypothetical protein